MPNAMLTPTHFLQLKSFNSEWKTTYPFTSKNGKHFVWLSNGQIFARRLPQSNERALVRHLIVMTRLHSHTTQPLRAVPAFGHCQIVPFTLILCTPPSTQRCLLRTHLLKQTYLQACCKTSATAIPNGIHAFQITATMCTGASPHAP